MKDLEELLNNIKELRNAVQRLSVYGVSAVDRFECERLTDLADKTIEQVIAIQEKICNKDDI